MTNEFERPRRVLRTPAVSDRIGVSRSTIYNWLDPRSKYHRPSFPRPFRIGASAVGWLEADVEQFISDIVASDDSGAAK